MCPSAHREGLDVKYHGYKLVCVKLTQRSNSLFMWEDGRCNVVILVWHTGYHEEVYRYVVTAHRSLVLTFEAEYRLYID